MGVARPIVRVYWGLLWKQRASSHQARRASARRRPPTHRGIVAARRAQRRGERRIIAAIVFSTAIGRGTFVWRASSSRAVVGVWFARSQIWALGTRWRHALAHRAAWHADRVATQLGLEPRKAFGWVGEANHFIQHGIELLITECREVDANHTAFRNSVQPRLDVDLNQRVCKQLD